jgi:hypothetical protein
VLTKLGIFEEDIYDNVLLSEIRIRMKERKESPSEDVPLVASVLCSKLTKINAERNALEVAKKMSENKISSVFLITIRTRSKE